MKYPPPRLVACPSCGCHVRAPEVSCVHCGAGMRSPEGVVRRTAAAIVMGLTTATLAGGNMAACAAYGIACTTGDCFAGASSSGAGGSGGKGGSHNVGGGFVSASSSGTGGVGGGDAGGEPDAGDSGPACEDAGCGDGG